MDFSNVKAFVDYMAEKRTPSNAVVIYHGGKKVYSYAA